jgi:hypothetical protein
MRGTSIKCPAILFNFKIRYTAGKVIADFRSRISERQSIDRSEVSPKIASRSSRTVAYLSYSPNGETARKHEKSHTFNQVITVSAMKGLEL